MATDPLWMRDVQNAQFMTYDPTKGWQGYTQDMGDFRHMFNDQQFNIAPEIQAYLTANGYGGPLQGTLQEMTTPANDAAANTDRQSRSDWMQANLGRTSTAPTYGASRIPELDAYLQQQGLTLQSGFTKDPNATQINEVQRLLDRSGNPVAVDAYNTRNAGFNKFMNFAAPAIIAAGSAAVGGQALGLLGGGGATSTLPGTLPGAGVTTPGIGAAEMAGIGLSNPAPLAMAPTFGGGAGITTAGIGAAELGGLSSAGLEAAGFANPIAYAPGVEGLGGGIATLGNGISTPKPTTPGLGPETTQGLGLSNPNPLPMAPTFGGGGLIDSLKNTGIGKTVGAVADAVGGGGNLAAIVGGALGATQGGKTDTATVSRNLDPRIDAALFGNGGYLSQLQQQFNATKGGNADMTAGADMLRSLYQSPQYSQGYEQMRNVGQGLLGQGVAANPFTNPGSAPAGLLGAFQPVARGQMPTAGLLPIPTRRGSI